MRFTVVTILPDLIAPSLGAGVVGRAREAGIITVDTVNPRDFTRDRHRTVDDTPYGGGPGMVMKAEPLLAAIARAMEPRDDTHVHATAPRDGTHVHGTAPREGPHDPHVETPSEPEVDAAALSELEVDDVDALGEPTDPLVKVERAIAKVESMLGSLGGAAGPLTPDVHLDRTTSNVADAEAALAEVESELLREAAEVATTPVSRVDDDVNLRAPSRNVRLGSLGPAGDTVHGPAALGSGAATAAAATGQGDPEMPNLVEPAHVAQPSTQAGTFGPQTSGTGASDPQTSGPQTSGPQTSGPQTSGPQTSGPQMSGQGTSAPRTSGPQTSGPQTSGQGTSAPRTSGPQTSGPQTSGPQTSGPKTSGPQTSGPKTSGPKTSGPQTSGPQTSGRTPRRILLSPSGSPLTQARVRELAKLDHLILVCGRYEGVDQRVIDLAIDEELSIGDYVLSGGELGALVVIDAVARLVPGVLGEPTSADDESFSHGLLEYPQYTRPPEITMPPALQSDRIASPVPAVLQSGNHAAIHAWRHQQAMQRTAARRPDLWRRYRPSKADEKLFAPLRARTHVALVHHPIVDRTGAVITTSLTNFDIHDIARSSMTYGLAGYHIVTPITAHREKADHIATLWMQDEQGEHRAQALRLIHTAESIEAVIGALASAHGLSPTVVATSARAESFPTAMRRTSSELLAEASLDPAPLLILLGTGWGLADALIPSVSRVLAPIEGASEWNHLSVRSAGAVILDRLFGRPA